ncbi:MAG: sugar phosphate isomerase/epimerase [Planctomycetota bacterium]|nr:sugar phosphate isomerase/epimerase [Planctomycetota bacterium]
MIQSAVTISLVQEAAGGPFVYWHDLAGSCQQASALGFDAVEVFPPSPTAVDPAELRKLLSDNGLKLAAVGTGAGWVKQKLHLCLPDPALRLKARDYIRGIIDFAGPFGAPAIIGSMQGRWSDEVPKPDAIQLLSEALVDLGEHAKQYGVPLLFEPINRYETNMNCSVEQGLALLKPLETCHIRLLCDLFHMNIEEVDIAASLTQAGEYLGHVHFVDSNRRPAGCGHLDYAPIAKALRNLNYNGYASAEALPWPNSPEAAKQTITAFRKHFH